MPSPYPRRPLPFPRLRTVHDSSLRDLVQTSWDDPHSPFPPSRRLSRPRRPPLIPTTSPQPPQLPPRAATDISGAALQAARIAQAAAQDAASASAAAAAAAEYARRLAVIDARNDVVAEGRRTPVDADGKWPDVACVALGKMWSVDVVAVWHNAVRIELDDLFLILSCLMDRDRGVTVTEVTAMFAWLSLFEAFVVTGLKAEEEVLYPWVEQWGRIEGGLSTAARITVKGGIIRGIRDVVACKVRVGLADGGWGNEDRRYYDGLRVGFAEMGREGVGEGGVVDAAECRRVVERVCALVRGFAAGLLAYFEEQERCLPRLIDGLYDVEDMVGGGIERRMVRAMWKCGRKDESIVILLRAVEESPRAKEWMGRNLKRLERVAVPLWKRRYYAGRGGVVAKFRERKRYWERNAASLDASHGSSLHRFQARMGGVDRLSGRELVETGGVAV